MKNLPDKIWLNQDHSVWLQDPKSTEYTEYVHKDTFIEKARKWFERYTEWRDLEGNRHCDMESFEDFRKYMEE